MKQKRVTHIKLECAEWHIKVEFCICRPITAVSPCCRGQWVWGGRSGATSQTTATNPQETDRYDNSSKGLLNYKIRSHLILTVVGTRGFPSSCFVTHEDSVAKPGFPSCHSQSDWPVSGSCLLFLVTQKKTTARPRVLSSLSLTQAQAAIPWIPVSNSFCVVLEPDWCFDCLSYASFQAGSLWL
jgi:hypothetical protein